MGDPDGTDVERVPILNNLAWAFRTLGPRGPLRALGPLGSFATIVDITHSETLFIHHHKGGPLTRWPVNALDR
jgi:hypothetical protein